MVVFAGFRMPVIMMQSMQACVYILPQGKNDLPSLLPDIGLRSMLLGQHLVLLSTLFDVAELDCHIVWVAKELCPESWRMLSDLSDSGSLQCEPMFLTHWHRLKQFWYVRIFLGLNVLCGSQMWLCIK